MNKVISFRPTAIDKKIEHTIEIKVEFAEPCTQWEAENIVRDALGDLLFQNLSEVKKDG